MAKKKTSMTKNNYICSICGPYKNWYIVLGIVFVILGIALWAKGITLDVAVAIVLILMGIKKLAKSIRC